MKQHKPAIRCIICGHETVCGPGMTLTGQVEAFEEHLAAEHGVDLGGAL